jgi:penicillin amidase
MKWTGMDYSNEIESVYKFNRASNWDEFREGVKTFTSISQNIAYADVDGNIGIQTAAGIPVRDEKGMMFFRGDTSAYDWKGMVPFEDLPYSYNPPSGFVA